MANHVSLDAWRKYLTDCSIQLALASAHITSAQNQPDAYDHTDHLQMLTELEILARGLLAQIVTQRDDVFKALCDQGVNDGS